MKSYPELIAEAISGKTQIDESIRNINSFHGDTWTEMANDASETAKTEHDHVKAALLHAHAARHHIDYLKGHTPGSRWHEAKAAEHAKLGGVNMHRKERSDSMWDK